MPPSDVSPADPTGPPARGRVRWRRFAILFVPAMAAAVTMVVLTTEGVLAASISVSGSAFEVSANQLQGTGFEQFGGVVTDGQGNPHPVAISAIHHATLTNLCQSVSVGGVTLRITAGGGSQPASASSRPPQNGRLRRQFRNRCRALSGWTSSSGVITSSRRFRS